MAQQTEKDIFKKGSKTYYNSSFFFPKKIRDDVYKLYSFVRVVDDFVDEQPAQPQKLSAITKAYFSGNISKLDDNSARVLKNILTLEKKYNFDADYVPAFLNSMQMDADGYSYKTMEDTLKYIYGSAEVIGLMMSKIIGITDKSALEAARLQGRAMQYINFIRDIKEDIGLGRCYFPLNERKKYGLGKWNIDIVNNSKFSQFTKKQIELFYEWQKLAELGWPKIPYRSRVAIVTAANMYLWTANKIYDNPKLVFETKVKPTKKMILAQGFKEALSRH